MHAINRASDGAAQTGDRRVLALYLQHGGGHGKNDPKKRGAALLDHQRAVRVEPGSQTRNHRQQSRCGAVA